MLTIKSLENSKNVGIYTSEGILEVRGKVGKRIHKLMGLDGTLCQKYISWRRRKNGNCFLTANYIAFGVTSGIGKLKSVKNGKYSIPIFHQAGDLENIDEERLPQYGIILDPNGVKLHAFIIVGENESDYICFHQRGDSGIYEATTLSQIRKDWGEKIYHRGYNLDSYAEEYIYINI